MSEKDLNDHDPNPNERHPVPAIEEAATGTVEQPDVSSNGTGRLRPASKAAVLVLAGGLIGSLLVANLARPRWVSQKSTYEVFDTESGDLAYLFKGQETSLTDIVPIETSPLRADALAEATEPPAVKSQWVVETVLDEEGEKQQYSLLEAKFHFGLWSLLPAVVAIAMCLLTKEPLSALFSAVVVGAFMLGQFDIANEVLIPNLASKSAATVLLLYLWLLGGLMGIWSRTGAAQAFAEFMTKHFVKGPRSAKLVAWMLGVLFFQGGTVSVVLVGTIVKPVADQENVSHEELAYIVDSTASPIASVLAFNAWPIYIQALIFVPGVSFLATEADRISFFFRSVPFSFYGILAVLSTLLISLGFTRFAGAGIRAAHRRAKETGMLDAPDAMPMSAAELQVTKVPEGYHPDVREFLFPLLLLLTIAVGTFILMGSPKVNWAFGITLLVSIAVALCKGMRLGHVVEGIGDGLKGVVLASVILMLAITVGSISREVGAGTYLVELLADQTSPWALPISLQLLTMVIAFSTGTSWGTYAISFPLAMPLAWQVAMANDLSQPELFMSICFATVLNGSVYGDQCSPISDTTILSAMTTGCDLMDHVKTQLVPATTAAALAAVMWTAAVGFCL